MFKFPKLMKQQEIRDRIPLEGKKREYNPYETSHFCR